MRLRITFAKTENMRYTGHLDLHRTWERTFRRAGLPLAYSQGFHPQPRINLACALPLGFTSDAELADVWLEQDLPLEDIQAALEPALPPGIQVLSLDTIPDNTPTLQTQVTSAVYAVTLLDHCSNLDELVQNVLQASSLERVRRGKSYDLRSLVEDIHRLEDDPSGRQRLSMRLAAREGATGRPEEVLAALAIQPQAARIHRTALVFLPNS